MAILEPHVLKLDLTLDFGQRGARRVFLIFGGHVHDLTNAIEPGESFGDLGSNRGKLN